MIRARFYIKKSDCDNDYRPVKWPIKYPYWCSAESSNSFVLEAGGFIRMDAAPSGCGLSVQ